MRWFRGAGCAEDAARRRTGFGGGRRAAGRRGGRGRLVGEPLHPDGHRFKGTVTSPAAACVVGRKVLLVRIEPDGSRTVVTHTFATESGRYATSIPMQSGNRFFARVKRVVTPLGTVCRADRSPTRTA